MRRGVGPGSWFGFVGLVFALGFGGSALSACGSDSPSNGGSAGASVDAGAGSGGTTMISGAGPSAGSPSGGSGTAGLPAGGASVGGGGANSADLEVAVSLTACLPACPDQQYCALLGAECTSEPCPVRAECRERPKCDAALACPAASQNTCLDDPSDTCNPAQGTACPGRCFCTEGPHPCGPLALDRRPTICTCVTSGPVKDCLNVNCPGDAVCDIVLGRAYCVSP